MLGRPTISDNNKSTKFDDFKLIGFYGTQANGQIKDLGLYVYNPTCGIDALKAKPAEEVKNTVEELTEEIPDFFSVPDKCIFRNSI